MSKSFTYRLFAVLMHVVLGVYASSLAYSQTIDGDTLRGQGAFVAGAGWYNLNTARGNAINVQAMRNFNEEVRLNYINRVRFFAEKKEGKKLSEDEAAKRREQRLTELRNNPNFDDIRSGEALNMLVLLLTDPNVKQLEWYKNAIGLPDGASIKDIVFQYFPNSISEKDLKIDVAISRLGYQVDWPLVLSNDSFAVKRKAYEDAVSQTAATVIMNKFDPKQLVAVDKCLESLLAEIKTTYADDKRGFKTKAIEFHGDLKASTKLFDGPLLDYTKELLRETEKHEAKTVGELVAFMLKYRLFFSRANSPRSIDLYDKLFRALEVQADAIGVKATNNDNKTDNGPEERAAANKENMREKPIDYFAVGSCWSGSGKYSIGVDMAKLVDNTWELTVTKRAEETFGGAISYFGTGNKKRINLVVKGTAQKLGKGAIAFGTVQQSNQSQNYAGEIKDDGSITLKFTGKGAVGQDVAGEIKLLKQ